jgi:hypothetical protein
VNDGVGIAEDLARAISQKNKPLPKVSRLEESRIALLPQPLESEAPKIPTITYSNPEEPKDGTGQFRRVRLAFGFWLKVLFIRHSKPPK